MSGGCLYEDSRRELAIHIHAAIYITLQSVQHDLASGALVFCLINARSSLLLYRGKPSPQWLGHAALTAG